MNIQLNKPEFQKFIDEQVRSGQFSSPEQVIEAGLARLMLDPPPEDLDEETLAAIDRAEAEFERGEGRPFKEFAAEFRAKYFSKP
jgi:Arc/MetJ-type ribon-helix-helix transcriptional regulator